MQCPHCHQETVQGAFCTLCGRSLAQPVAPASFQVPPTAPTFQPAYFPPQHQQSNNPTKLIVAILALVLITGGAGYGVAHYIKVQNEKKAAAAAAAEYQAELDAIQAEKDDYSWVPEGYEKFDINYNLAYKKSSYDNCWDTCYPFRVVSKYACSYLYVEGDIEQDGITIDWTNDTEYDVEPGYYYEMTMESAWDAPWTVTFTEANCHS